jgi:hypothetical protein
MSSAKSHSSRPSTPELEPILGTKVGQVVGVDAQGRLLVDFAGNPVGPMPARSTLPLDEQARQTAVATRQQAVLLFENGDPRLPLLMGLLQPTSETPHLDALLSLPAAPEHEPVETTVDGRRVVLTAQDEIVLRCGQSSIVLRRNGQVIIRGLQVETRATGLNRIKGGNVQIN